MNLIGPSPVNLIIFERFRLKITGHCWFCVCLMGIVNVWILLTPWHLYIFSKHLSSSYWFWFHLTSKINRVINKLFLFMKLMFFVYSFTKEGLLKSNRNNDPICLENVCKSLISKCPSFKFSLFPWDLYLALIMAIYQH